MSHLARLSALLCGLVILAGPGALPAAAPDEELLRLVPRDTTFFLLIKDLRGHEAATSDGPFARSLRASKLGQTLAGTGEVARVEEVARQLASALQIDWPKLRDDLFGDAVVLAYQAGPAGKPEQERGAILTWARDPKLPARLFERLDTVQKESGELTSTEMLSHRGQSYGKRIKAKGPAEFYWLKGSVAALSTQEAMIHDLIDLDEQAPPAREKPPLARQLDSLEIRDAFMTLWVNARRFDAELLDKSRAAAGNEAAFLAAFARCWKALDGIALTCRVERHVELNLTIAARTAELPPALTKVVGALAQPAALNAAFPADALATLAGRVDLPAMIELLSGMMDAAAWQGLSGSVESGLAPVLGKKYLMQLATHIGPDWGVCVMPPATPRSLLPDAVVAIRIKPSADGSLEKALLDACEALSTIARLHYNARSDEPVRLETLRDKGGEIKFLSHPKLFAPGVRPAYALRDGHLVLATSPDAIQRLDLGKAGAAAALQPNRIATISLSGWFRYLSTRRGELVSYLPTLTGGKSDEISGQLDQLQMLLELFDRLELVNESARPGQLKLSLKLHPLQPLRK
jgi:hypothetical protein